MTVRDDIDPVVVERLVDGHPVRATLPEKRDAARRLLDRGVNHCEVARRVNVAERTVERWVTTWGRERWSG